MQDVESSAKIKDPVTRWITIGILGGVGGGILHTAIYWISWWARGNRITEPGGIVPGQRGITLSYVASIVDDIASYCLLWGIVGLVLGIAIGLLAKSDQRRRADDTIDPPKQ